jgi:tetratricopeptide (TPR) repeat protein
VLLATAAQGPLGELGRAISQRLRGEIALDLSRGSEAAPLLLDAAQRLEPLDVALARETYLEARSGRRATLGASATASSARPRRPALRRLRLSRRVQSTCSSTGLAILFTDGYADGAPILKRALVMFRDGAGRDERDMRGTRIAARIAAELLDDETWSLLATRHVQIARDAGLFGVPPITLGYLAGLRIHEGNLHAAALLLDESDAITATTGSPANVTRLLLTACRGDEAQTSALGEALEAQATARGDGLILTVCEYARLLYDGLGRYDSALAAAQRASALDDLSVSSWSLPELVEAAVRSGDHRAAVDALERLSERTAAAGTDRSRGPTRVRPCRGRRSGTGRAVPRGTRFSPGFPRAPGRASRSARGRSCTRCHPSRARRSARCRRACRRCDLVGHHHGIHVHQIPGRPPG